jgi:hypothetical protein
MTTHKHADAEDEYFAREEYERKKAIEEKKHALMAEEDKTELKELHHMKCPKCGMDLVTIDYKGVQIDRCSGCEGVWLDCGELEAIAALEHGTLSKMFTKVFKVKDEYPDHPGL